MQARAPPGAGALPTSRAARATRNARSAAPPPPAGRAGPSMQQPGSPASPRGCLRPAWLSWGAGGARWHGGVAAAAAARPGDAPPGAGPATPAPAAPAAPDTSAAAPPPTATPPPEAAAAAPGLASRVISAVSFGYLSWDAAPPAPAAVAAPAAPGPQAAPQGRAAGAPGGGAAGGKRHLVVFVNGLTGAASNWDYLVSQVGGRPAGRGRGSSCVCAGARGRLVGWRAPWGGRVERSRHAPLGALVSTPQIPGLPPAQLPKRLPPSVASELLPHQSAANERLATWHGIDRCGQRLAEEVRGIVAAPENAGLERISFVAHSMGGAQRPRRGARREGAAVRRVRPRGGKRASEACACQAPSPRSPRPPLPHPGLITRYALGVLYNPQTRRVAGLEPEHFVTLATPHFGCARAGGR
jgi:hypothetical protein